MTIETKYNIGDEVWFASGGKEMCGYIEYLRIHYECGRWEEDKVESYTVRGFDDILYAVEAESLFPTKEELLKSL